MSGNRLSDRNMLSLFDWSAFCPFRCGHLKGESSGDRSFGRKPKICRGGFGSLYVYDNHSQLV